MRTAVPEPAVVVPIATAVIVQGLVTAGPFVVDELSPRAIELHGPSQQNLSPGDATVIISTADGKCILRLAAAVTFSAWRAGYCVQVRLHLVDLSADEEDQIQDIVTRHIEGSRVPVTIILDSERLRTKKIQRFLESMGRHALFASTNLEALWLLERFGGSCGTILVDHSFIKTNGRQTLLFLHRHFRDKRRILVLPVYEPAAIDVSDLAWSVHGVLAWPWTDDHLKSALGLVPAQEARTRGRILFVDDEPAVLSGLEHRLHRYLNQYDTVWVTSAEAALSETKARPFDVVVTDLRMPGMDGVTLLRAIKAQSPKSKRIILSGHDLHAAKDVANVVLEKPCPLERLRLEILAPTGSD